MARQRQRVYKFLVSLLIVANLADMLNALLAKWAHCSDSSVLKFTAKLRAEYKKSLAAPLPLKQRLAQKDLLIDLVVYGLYGLTEGEMGWRKGIDHKEL